MKKNILLISTLFITIFLFISCDILRDSPFEVETWTPGTGYFADPSLIKLTFLFSTDPDKGSVERSFSITEDGLNLKGTFSWEGKRLVFNPSAPLEYNKDYFISILTDAQDKKGVSMDREFKASFTTRLENNRPDVLAINPGNNTILLDTRGEIYIDFSESVTAASCANHISFSPSMGGSWRIENNNRTAIFTSVEPWTMGTRYSVTISANFLSASGRLLGKEFKSYFTIGNDTTPPELVSAYAVDKDGNSVFQLQPDDFNSSRIENNNWKSDYRILLNFSEPVAVSGVQSHFTVEPSANLVLESSPDFSDSILFRLSEKPKYQSRFLFKISSGIQDAVGNKTSETIIFRIFADNPLSKPPSLIGIRMPMTPGGANESAQQAVQFAIEDLSADLPIESGTGKYPFDVSTSTWIELYFDTAPGAEVNLFSIMDLFRIDVTNSAFSFSPRSARNTNFTWTNPYSGWQSYSRVEVRGQLTNKSNTGVVTFFIASGLLDSLGNKNDDTFAITVLK